ncbi:MAG TPA: hypothetical protein VL002_01960 [Candidimonas sp.]|nr:hypothetical protein [Candidimonas sp.]
MGKIHVSRSLKHGQKIFRYVSFYDLIELLTFSQISFISSAAAQRKAPLNKAKKRSESLERIDIQEEPAIRSIAYQSWALLDEEEAIDWYAADISQPRICIISSVGALSESLFMNDSTNVFIERTYHAIQDPTPSRRLLTETLPRLDNDTVSVIVSSTHDAKHTSQTRSNMRLLVDLKTLLAGVIVSPDASIRFLELAAKLVQQTTCAFVSRARRPSFQTSGNLLTDEPLDYAQRRDHGHRVQTMGQF